MAGFGEDDAALVAVEKRRAEAFLEQADLVADGGLGHAEFGGGAGKIAVARRGLEDPDGGERRQLARRWTISLAYAPCLSFRWRCEAGRRKSGAAG
ncbi:hypothetical protein GCM10011529_00230 [Polymorphobacter glacialis]|uniref:Uncharacterized protein n=1 Tax=Sandarakinorhabdus glacialis TaxID=1614636 RepID=A0A916ZH60_9SPHN|nr:hypothetical protein GCM10011529_00230 [Polymorphobacter glacialis]